VAVSYVAGSDTGNSVQATSRGTAVPAGAAVDDIVVAWLGQWQSGSTPTGMTPPTGFTQKGASWSSGDGAARNSTWWKRLTAADTGTYTFSWTGSFWTTLQCQCFRGVVTSGDPFDGTPVTAVGTWGAIPTQSKDLSDAGGGLVWAVYNDTAGLHTPPTGFVETADVDSGSMAYSLPGSAGPIGAAGASIASSSAAGLWYGALIPAEATPIPEMVGNSSAMAAMTGRR
jgi:hypothetical protein